MGVTLQGMGGHLSFNWWGWQSLLDLAADHGWEPRGTDPPELAAGGWSGTYCSNDGQVVTTEDAAGIATALICALKELPEWSDPRKEEMIRRFVAYCKAGAFEIF